MIFWGKGLDYRMTEKEYDDDYRMPIESRQSELDRIEEEERENAAYLEELNAPAE